MFLIPLNQIESVELVVHALKAAGGEADCSVCPVRKVCMKQCLAIADAVGRMIADGSLPSMGEETDAGSTEKATQKPSEEKANNPRPSLKIIK